VEQFFDGLAGEKEPHKRIAMRNPWGPLASYRIASKYLKGKVLDVGCGSGGLAERNPNHIFVGVDISAKQLQNARTHLSPIRASASHLPIKNKSFDTAVALGVVQNSGIPAKILIGELSRTAKSIVITGLSDRKRTKDPLEVYHDPTEILRMVSEAMGNAKAEWGAIRYQEAKVWTEDWNKPDNGTFYIYASRVSPRGCTCKKRRITLRYWH